MSNMGYCRFENTLADLRDCASELSTMMNLDQLSSSEAKAANSLIRLCRKIAEDWDADG
jgi:hypothetical protein